MCRVNYVRLFAGPDGESHFEDIAVELAPVVEYARGVPQLLLSAPRTSTGLTFVSAPPGWVGDWHPPLTPVRWSSRASNARSAQLNNMRTES
jgi:hypothetical protein